MPTSSESADLYTRIERAEAELNALSKDVAHDEGARQKLYTVAKDMATTLESPLEVFWRMMMEPHQSASLRTAMAMGLIEPIATSDTPKTASELAVITKCNKQLIVRVMRPLVAMTIFDEVAYETYAATPKAKIFTIQSVLGGYKFMYDEAATAVIHMPAFLNKTGFKNPEGPMGNFQSAFNTQLQLFPWLIEHPEHMSNFNDLMAGQRANRIEWHDFAPVDNILFREYEGGSDGTLLVDIGGGRGHDLEAFRNRFPEAKGKLVLQDLPPVIDDIRQLHGDIVRMKYDFFTPQPIKGARAYYLRSILHDYSDGKCREILHNIVSVMTPGYSKLLIFEWILPDVGSLLYPALLDINMLALLSGMERTETQWKELLDSVGLEIVKFHTIDKATEGLIEAVRKP